MKTISAFTRRADLSREAFRDYYETRHAPLGMTHLPFAKYVRNHVVEPPASGTGLDCISEFYLQDWHNSAKVTKSAVGELFSVGEEQFMDRSRIGAAVVEETVVQGPERAVDRAPVRRRILCVGLPTGEDRQAAVRELLAWAARLPANGRRVTVDPTVGPAGVAFPYNTPFPHDALVSIWSPDATLIDAASLPAGAVMQAELLADICESPPEEIARRYQLGA